MQVGIMSEQEKTSIPNRSTRSTIAYLGPSGSFSELAAGNHFPYALLAAESSIMRVFESVGAGEADIGVVPSESLVDGAVGQTLDLLVKHNDNVRIFTEIMQPVSHCIASRSKDGAITKIMSHQKALAQCSGYLRRNYPHAELVDVESTSLAMQRLCFDDYAHHAAIGREDVARSFGLHVLDPNIQDHPHNFTLFYAISRYFIVPPGADKTTICVEIPPERNYPGVLHDILSPLKEFGVNLSRIESRPTGRARGEYRFYLDMDGSLHDDCIRSVIDRTTHIADVKILGSYKSADVPVHG